MPEKRKARPAVESKRASVKKDGYMIPRIEWERGCGILPLAFALATAAYAAWEVLV
ncbi:hypothetical protein [Gordonibacter massiliensis (ex Traore et al. 2017)]|uniref:hypothetical protein n=1 Tax=Gordonibacter massiliensis (ex Traore et al. 2017) TaxID=1841863 RepID=UPI001C8C8BB9|nr:hypothetical protein [Gordonibacter massiliensis (ex Traore et al. 2017)]MBX9032641.1 hypothetical protein [Gordonibacter massiliensis (ex Traore et al. 2017)]